MNSAHINNILIVLHCSVRLGSSTTCYLSHHPSKGTVYPVSMNINATVITSVTVRVSISFRNTMKFSLLFLFLAAVISGCTALRIKQVRMSMDQWFVYPPPILVSANWGKRVSLK